MGAPEEPRAYADRDLTYHTYLRIDELTSLQHPESDPPHHDEMLFIIIHQAFELWFKLVLHELHQAMAHMRAQEALQARHFIHRAVEVMELFVKQIHILETMRPVDFLAFRDRLNPASGFQSVQFREIEFLCGLKDERYLRFFQATPEHVERLKARMEEPDLRRVYYDMLAELGFDLPEDVSQGHLEADEKAREQVLTALRPIYEEVEEHLPLNMLTESLVSLDEGLALWREHHVRVVERIIGKKRGTGGSSGVEYLETTLSKRCFPQLWQVRTELEDPR